MFSSGDSTHLKESGTFPTLEINVGHSRGNSSTARDPEYAKVLEGSKHYSNYFLEHPELANKVRRKSLVKRLIGYHKHSIDIKYVALILKNGALDTKAVSDYDRAFIKSMFTLLGLQDTPTAEDFVLTTYKFLEDLGASEKEIALAFLKQLHKKPHCSNVLGKRNKKLISYEAVYLFNNSGLKEILVEQSDYAKSLLDRISKISVSSRLLEVDLGFKTEVTAEERAYRNLSYYDYFQIANEAQRAVYVKRYLAWCSSYARFGSNIAWYLSARTGKILSVAKREVIQNYMTTGAIFPASLDWDDFIDYLQGNEKLVAQANSFRGVHD